MLCAARVSPLFDTHSAVFHMNERLVEQLVRFRIELIPDSTVYTLSDLCHATFTVFSFETQIKAVLSISDWYVLV